jgi:hypothetical protein
MTRPAGEESERVLRPGGPKGYYLLGMRTVERVDRASRLHRGDPRLERACRDRGVYAEFGSLPDEARTHDEIWNAAQRELDQWG